MDPLWNNPHVQKLTEKRGNRSHSEERRSRQRYYYRRKREKENLEKKRIQSEADVAAGIISKEDTDKAIGQMQTGCSHYQHNVADFQDQPAAAQPVGNINDIGQSRVEAMNRTRLIVGTFSGTYDDLAALFRKTSSPNGGLPLIPTTSSSYNFLEFLVHFLPMSMWQVDPMHGPSIDVVRTILSSDERSPYRNLAPWFSEAEKSRILWNFNAAVKEAKDYWNVASILQKREFCLHWRAVRENMQRSFFPIHNVSCTIFHQVLKAAYDMEDLDRGYV
jgi:hypothetical protein